MTHPGGESITPEVDRLMQYTMDTPSFLTVQEVSVVFAKQLFLIFSCMESHDCKISSNQWFHSETVRKAKFPILMISFKWG